MDFSFVSPHPVSAARLQVACATDRYKMFSHRTPALLGQSSFPAAPPPLCRCRGDLPGGQGPGSHGEPWGRWAQKSCTEQGATSNAEPPVSRAQPKHLLTCHARGSTCIAALGNPHHMCKCVQGSGWGPCTPRTAAQGDPAYPIRLLRGTLPTRLRSHPSLLGTDIQGAGSNQRQ